ncbi:glycosyl-transferase for dystroglycan-domain-containing protein [Gongronella butleri]|nr:glycosyl-transferase for dystroglycan-domain-containing protein [Gongronella butleri]
MIHQRSHPQQRYDKEVHEAWRPRVPHKRYRPTKRLFFILVLLIVSLGAYWHSATNKTPAAQPTRTHKTLRDQPAYETLHNCQVRVCNPSQQCITWTAQPNKTLFDATDLAPEHVYRDVASVHVQQGCDVSLQVQDENSGLTDDPHWVRLAPDTETDCIKMLCRNTIAIKIQGGLNVIGAQLKELLDNDQQQQRELVFPWIRSSLDDEKVTLVTQFTVNRLPVFANVIDAWKGPIAIALYLTEPSDIDTLNSFLEDQNNRIDRYDRVSMVIVKPETRANGVRVAYPINHLRNLAILAASTPFIFVMDADFAPSPSLYASIHALLPESSFSASRTAIVVPCFAVREDSTTLPESMDDMAAWVKQGRAYLTDPGAGHGPTLGKEMALTWAHLHGDAQLPATYEVCYESQWEPYYVVPREAPLYDVRFKNQGGDKQSHALHLNAEGYRFLVMRHEFIVHKDHPKMVWPGQGFPEAQKDASKWNYFAGFMQEIDDIYGKLARWPRACSALAIGWHEQRRSTLGMAVAAV